MSAITVVTTVGTEDQANLIARELLCRRQAACVNIIPGVRSIYRWQGKICSDGELMLVIKTSEAEFTEVNETIREFHSYDLPEILAFQIQHGDRSFLQWVHECLDKSAGVSEDEEEEVPGGIDPDSVDF